MELCNYNKNILLLYASKILFAMDLKIEWNEYAYDRVVYWKYLTFSLDNSWINYEEKSVIYNFFTDCGISKKPFRWCKFYLTIYWWQYGKG
jgi:hypothetical protein